MNPDGCPYYFGQKTVEALSNNGNVIHTECGTGPHHVSYIPTHCGIYRHNMISFLRVVLPLPVFSQY